MRMKLPRIQDIGPKQIFLVDAVGAVSTALLLSQLLARFENAFGMDKEILYGLAWAAVAFAVYSFANFLLPRPNWRTFLKGIAIANALYCAVTLALVIFYFGELTWLGIVYFLGEIVVVLALVRVEFLVARGI